MRFIPPQRAHLVAILAVTGGCAASGSAPSGEAPPADVPSIAAPDTGPGSDARDAGSTGETGDAPSTAIEDALVDGAPGDGASADDAAVSPAWELPPCYRACDRVVSCGVDACEGWTWATSGQLFEACFQACTGHLSDLVLGAAACTSVLDAARPHVALLDAGCPASSCPDGCARFADCTVQECPGVGAVQRASLDASCLTWCTAPTASWLLQPKDCADLVDAVSVNNPGFVSACGKSTVCAEAAQCGPWAAKVAGCMVEHCAGNLDPWAASVEQLLAAFCSTPPDCPPPADVAALLSGAVTCDHPALAPLGPAPPFTALCDGSAGVTPAEATGACEALLACPATAGLGPPQKCAGQVAILPDAAVRIACLAAAPGCADVYACLEGL